MQRVRVMARCWKSRQTPTRSMNTSVGRFRRTRGVVVEGYLVVHPVADRDGALPARFLRSEFVVCNRTKLVDFTIPARKQKLENLGGEVIHAHLLCVGE